MKMFNWVSPLWLCQNVFTLYGKGGDAPPTPDFAAAAKETASGNLDAAKYAAAANRVNQVTPYGNLTYSQNPNTGSTFNQSGYDQANSKYQQDLANYNKQPQGSQYGGGLLNPYNVLQNQNRGSAPTAPDRNSFYSSGNSPDTYTATQTLSPAEQQKLNSNNQLSQGFLNTANSALGQVNSAVNQGFNFNALPKQQVDAGQTGQDAIMARLQPQFGRDENALHAQLANQGITQGSEAYNNAQDAFGRAKNDAYSQAALSGIGVGQQARQQALQEQEFGRTEPINIINSLRTGNQVQMPSFVNSAQQQATAGPDLLGAANASYQGQLGAYNAQKASGNSFTSGLFGIGGSLLGGPVGGAIGTKVGSWLGN